MGTILVKLKEPFWSAYKKYGWEYGTPAYSLKHSTVKNAILCEHGIVVEYGRLEDCEGGIIMGFGFETAYEDKIQVIGNIYENPELINSPETL